jgi:hypothetical protein
MSRMVCLTAAFTLLAWLPASLGADDKEKPANRNTLLARYKGQLKLSASSTYDGWPLEKLIDGNTGTSWFSKQGDSAAKCQIPWIEVEFPEDVTVSRVTLLGNREANWPFGFDVLLGRLELYDKDGTRLSKQVEEGAGVHHDYDFALDKPVKGVRKLRFTSLRDQGDQTQFEDIGLAELQIE